MKTSNIKKITLPLIAAIASQLVCAETVEPLKYGNFENWVTRSIKESGIIGGKTKNVYEIGPTKTMTGATPYEPLGGSPWATSNILAKVVGITKTSNAVFPDTRESGGMCCKLSTIMEDCKAAGLINIDVVVAGSIFLGRMFEPITSTKSPYSKMEMGIPFTKRPKAVQFDYKLFMPANTNMVYSSGLSKKKTYNTHDSSEVYIFLQRRWEDEDGNIYAKRVGTGRERYAKSTNGWVNNHRMPIKYGDITGDPDFKSYMDLIPADRNYYARNSKGKMVPVQEVGWDEPDATPTHMLLMASAGSGKAYYGTIGLTLWIDNIALVYD